MNKSSKKFPFHGGCINCKTYKALGQSLCPLCQFYEPNWSLPNLKIENDDNMETIISKFGMTEKERIKLIDVGLRVLGIQVFAYHIKMIVRLDDLLNEKLDPTVTDILKLRDDE